MQRLRVLIIFELYRPTELAELGSCHAWPKAPDPKNPLHARCSIDSSSHLNTATMGETIDLCCSSSDDDEPKSEAAAAAMAASSVVASGFDAKSTPKKKRPRSPMFGDDDDSDKDSADDSFDLDTSGVTLSGGSNSSKENHKRKTKIAVGGPGGTAKSSGGAKYSKYDFGGSDSDSDDSDIPPPSGLHPPMKKIVGSSNSYAAKTGDEDDNDIVVLNSDSDDDDDDDDFKKPPAAAKSQQVKAAAKSIRYDEDDAGIGSDDSSAKKMPAKSDEQKKPAAESEVMDLLSSSDDDEDTHGGNDKPKAKPTVYVKGRVANYKKSYGSNSNSSLSSFGGGRKKRSISSKGKPKRGDSDSDSDRESDRDNASHASMDSFDWLEMQCISKQKEAEQEKSASKSRKARGRKQASVASSAAAIATETASSSPDATYTNVYNALKSDDDGDGIHQFHYDDNDDDLAVPTAAAASALPAKTPAKSSNQRFSSDNGNGMFSPSARKVKVPVIPMISNDTLNRIGGKLYPDLCHAFVKRLLRHAKEVRRRHWEKDAFDGTVRAIMALSLRSHPVRSAEVCKEIKGIGAVLQDVLKDAVSAEGATPYCPPKGKLSAVAPAAVLSMRQWTDSNPDEPLCTMEELIERVNNLLDPRAGAAMTEDVAYYLDKNNFDPGWAQIRKLCSADVNAGRDQFLRQRARKGRSTSGVVFELTDEGKVLAKQIQGMIDAGPVEPGPLRQYAKSEVSQDFKHVTLSVDFREGGGGRFNLHKMCSTLEILGCPFVVRELKIADYVYFVGNKLAPFLVERKSIEDVAHSVADGRWERQQRNMRQAQYVLGGPDRKCHIGYLIEGDASNVVVHGGKVGRTSWGQSEEDVEKAIDSLAKLGFFIMRSRNHKTSMAKLAALAKEVSWQKRNGSLDATFTYDEFIAKMRQCDKKEGDPPTDRLHQYPSAPLVDDYNKHYEHRRSPDARRVGGEDPTSDTAVPLPAAASATAPAASAGSSELEAELQKLSAAELKRRCKERDEATGGKKGELIARLLKPRKPEILIVRKRNGDHVPSLPSCNAALLIGLLLNTRPGEGMSKEELMIRADECGASKVAMDQKNGFYDGWAGMSTLKTGDPALVCMKKRLHCLTTQPQGSSGRDVARALHILAHREGHCRCGQNIDEALLYM